MTTTSFASPILASLASFSILNTKKFTVIRVAEVTPKAQLLRVPVRLRSSRMRAENNPCVVVEQLPVPEFSLAVYFVTIQRLRYIGISQKNPNQETYEGDEARDRGSEIQESTQVALPSVARMIVMIGQLGAVDDDISNPSEAAKCHESYLGHSKTC
jgi:hypothetical protein